MLASAAYNAGPHRVSQWHQRFGGSSAAEWIERIPFDETRRYVQNVLAYAVIYGGDRPWEGTPLLGRKSASFRRRPRAKALGLLTVLGTLAGCAAAPPSP